MHPPLAVHLHPMCQEAISDLEQCHRQRKFLRFLGACNKAKAQLDKCLADEYLVRRELNAEQARTSRERLRQSELDIEAEARREKAEETN